MKTKAAVSYAPGQPLVVEELELDPPKAHEVLVRMVAVGLCHSDYHVIAGDRPVGMRPMVLGHEGAGVVEAVGPGVTRIQPGDHVVLTFIPSCGKCRWCISGMSHACVLGTKIAQGPQLDELVTHTYSLDQINDGYADMLAGKNIRGVVRFEARA